jgi:hypothetical protein
MEEERCELYFDGNSRQDNDTRSLLTVVRPLNDHLRLLRALTRRL